MRERSRIFVFILLLATIVAGLGSRVFSAELPAIFANYAGDTLWAAALYWMIALLLQKKSILMIAVPALLISFAVEFSQLCRTPWLNKFRESLLGSLTLGHAFLLSDLFCYLIGIGFAAALDVIWVSRKRTSDSLGSAS